MKKLFIFLISCLGCSFPLGCSYLTPSLDAVKPYIDMVKPSTDEKMENMARIIARSIKIESNHDDIKIKEIKILLGRVNKQLKLNTGVITIPMIFDVPGLGEKNRDRIGLAMDLVQYEYGNLAIKTPVEYQWVLELIGKVHEKL